MRLHIAHRYLLRTATAHALVPSPTILDYGCGAGQVIDVGRQAGLEVYGVRMDPDGSAPPMEGALKNPTDSVVRTAAHRTIPFEANRFDAVICNQVLDQVPNLDDALAEIYRVLKPGGTLLCTVPTREQFREGGVGIPFVHWFAEGSRTRFYYTLALRTIGLGHFKDKRSRRQWTCDALAWVDQRTHHRDRRAIMSSFARWFTFSLIEPDYAGFRLEELGFARLARVAQHPWVQPLVRELVHRLGSPIILAQKPLFAR